MRYIEKAGENNNDERGETGADFPHFGTQKVRLHESKVFGFDRQQKFGPQDLLRAGMDEKNVFEAKFIKISLLKIGLPTVEYKIF